MTKPLAGACFQQARAGQRYLSETPLAEQLCQVLRGLRGTADDETSCLAYEDVTRWRDKGPVQAGFS
jgi:hypothetical protein